MGMTKYLLIFWAKSQHAEEFDYLLQLFAANRGSCELLHEARWSMLVSYEGDCLDEVTSNQNLDAWIYSSLKELLKEQEAETLEELKADLDHSDDLIDAGQDADDDEFENNLLNLL